MYVTTLRPQIASYMYIPCSRSTYGCPTSLPSSLPQIQGHNPNVPITWDASDDGEMSPRYSVVIDLPPCELSRLGEIEELVTSVIPLPVKRESLSLAIEKDSYIPKLLDLFHVCEDLENTDGLHHLYNIFKTLFLINNSSLLALMFQDELITDVVGCLEYNPAKAAPVRHREYLAKTSQHHEVIPFSNPDLLAKIHQTYKVFHLHL